MSSGALVVEVVVGAYDGMIIGATYDILSSSSGLQPRFNEKGHLSMVSVLDTSKLGVIATGSSDETIKLYNISNHTELGTLMLHEGTITGLQFCKDWLISCSEDGLVCVWDCRTWECIHVLSGHRGAVYSVAAHPSGKIVLSVGKDKTVRTWDLMNGRQAFVKKLSNVPELIKWSPVGDQYIIGFNTHQLVLYDVESGQELQEIKIGKRINSIVFLQDSVIAIGSDLSDILIYSTDNGNCITRLIGHANRIKGLQFLSGANLLFSVSSNGSVMVWKTNDDNLCTSECISQWKLSSRLTNITIVPPRELLDKKSQPSVSVSCIKRRKEYRSEHAGNKEHAAMMTEKKVLSKRKKLLLLKMRRKKNFHTIL